MRVTEFPNEYFPEKAKLRKKIKEEFNEEALKERNLLAQNGASVDFKQILPS